MTNGKAHGQGPLELLYRNFSRSGVSAREDRGVSSVHSIMQAILEQSLLSDECFARFNTDAC
jgi:hypothetical protein